MGIECFSILSQTSIILKAYTPLNDIPKLIYLLLWSIPWDIFLLRSKISTLYPFLDKIIAKTEPTGPAPNKAIVFELYI